MALTESWGCNPPPAALLARTPMCALSDRNCRYNLCGVATACMPKPSQICLQRLWSRKVENKSCRPISWHWSTGTFLQSKKSLRFFWTVETNWSKAVDSVPTDEKGRWPLRLGNARSEASPQFQTRPAYVASCLGRSRAAQSALLANWTCASSDWLYPSRVARRRQAFVLLGSMWQRLWQRVLQLRLVYSAASSTLNETLLTEHDD